MKTNQIMIRQFYNKEIRQRTADKFFNATDLLTIYNRQEKGNKRVMGDFLRNNQTKRFVKALADDLSKDGNSHLLPDDMFTVKRGKNGGTWHRTSIVLMLAVCS